MALPPHPPDTPPATLSPHAGRLESWKEIAAYLNRSVTTVQRWEEHEGLPVHRLQHEKAGSVYALVSELDQWMHEREASGRRDRAPRPEPRTPTAPATSRTARRVALGVATASLVLGIALSLGWRRPSSAPEVIAGDAPAAVASADARAAGTSSDAAYEEYRRGMAAFDVYSDRGRRQAAAHFRRAVTLDPSFARAHAGIAIALLHGTMSDALPDSVVDEAREAVRAAFAAYGTKGEAYSARGTLLDLFEWDWGGAEAAHRRAIELAPGSHVVRMGFAHHLGLLGHYDEALAEARRAVALAPTSNAAAAELFWASIHARRFEDCVAQAHAQRARLGDDPLAKLADYFGRYCGARLGRVSAACAGAADAPVCGLAWIAAGNRVEARRILQRSCTGHVRQGQYTCLQLAAALGHPEWLLEWVEQKVADRDKFCAFFRGPEIYDVLKDERRFQAALARVGLADGSPLVATRRP